MKKIICFLFCLMAGVGTIFAQTVRVSGTVISATDNESIPGVSIIVKGNATIGTMTTVDGRFAFDVPQSAQTLIFRSMGMKEQEVTVSTSPMTVVMQESISDLDEVIVVAYGTAKKSQFTGSASVVKASDIGKVQTTNVTNALVGRVTGMQIANASGQPGVSSPTVRVRGIASIGSSNDPLVIVDGAPYSGDLNTLNSMDIETVTILKDATSNALYGARGANGVIMVTTKKGASGVATVTVDAKWGANTRATLDYDYIKSPAHYYELYYSGLKNYFSNSLDYSSDRAHMLANQYMTSVGDYGLGYNVYNVPNGQYLIGNNGKLNPNATLGNILSYRGSDYLLTPDNWLKAAYRQSLRQEYNVTISGSSEKSSFYSSFGYLDQQGITAKSEYKRFTGRLKADYQVKPWMKAGANMFYANSSYARTDNDGASNSSGNIFAIATRIAPIYPLFIRDRNGNTIIDNNGIQMYDYGDGGNAGLRRPALSNSNALQSNDLDSYYGEGNTINANHFVDITFLNDFKFSSINTVIVSENRQSIVVNPYYGQYASSNGIISKYHTRRFDYDFQQLLTYIKDFNKHHLNVLVGHDYYRAQYFYLQAEKMNVFDPSNHELNGAVKDGSPGSYTTDYNHDGYFSRLMYDYDNKYHGNFSYRRDASSRFHPDNRFGNFWAAGVAWEVSKEYWMDFTWVDMFKVKASYGEQGNDGIGNYRYVDTYSIVNSSGRPAAVPNQKGNKDITWETIGSFNTGVDFSLFNERLNGTIDYYNRKTIDMLYSFPLPPSFGWSAYYANIGDMRNRGIEIDLSYTAIKTNDMTWTVRTNLTTLKNKILKMPEERKSTTTVDGTRGYSSGNMFIGEGASFRTFYMLKYAGVNADGQATYYQQQRNNKGDYTDERKAIANPSDATYYLCGTSLPDAYGGFGTAITYRGFDFSIDFSYQLGGLVYDADYAASMGSPRANGNRGYAFHADILKAWTPENKDSNIPRFQYNDQYTASASDRFLTNASYLSLQNINLGYTVPKRICNRAGVDKIRIYGVCDNVWIWSKRQGLDPRQGFEGSDVTASYYAPIRSFSGGLTITF